MEHEVRLASHDTSPFLAQEPYTVAGREPVPRLVVSEVSSFEKDWPAVRAEKNAATVGYMPSAMLVHDVDIDAEMRRNKGQGRGANAYDEDDEDEGGQRVQCAQQ